MKKFSIAIVTLLIAIGFTANAQKNEDKSKRPSPPAKVTQKLKSGATVSIDYSQPSVKGRTIGKDLEPMQDSVWRTGANEATVFETDKEINFQGQTLPAGKYGLFTIFHSGECTLIINKTWNQWGAFKYKKADDVFRVNAKVSNLAPPSEKMTFTITEAGVVNLLWGNLKVTFIVH